MEVSVAVRASRQLLVCHWRPVSRLSAARRYRTSQARRDGTKTRPRRRREGAAHPTHSSRDCDLLASAPTAIKYVHACAVSISSGACVAGCTRTRSEHLSAVVSPLRPGRNIGRFPLMPPSCSLAVVLKEVTEIRVGEQSTEAFLVKPNKAKLNCSMSVFTPGSHAVRPGIYALIFDERTQAAPSTLSSPLSMKPSVGNGR